jgi:DNA-binding XRE family transcriptional regulator
LRLNVAYRWIMNDQQLRGRDRKSVGLRLILTRQALGLDQQTFASTAGLKNTTYNQYESGINMPSIDAAHKLCDAFQLTLEWIFRGDASNLRARTEAAIMALVRAREGANP